eukprot:3875769-Ditylum_brightwellii.AAC.1
MSTVTSTMAQANKFTQFDKSALMTHLKTTTAKSKRHLLKDIAIDYILGKTELLHRTIKKNLTTLGTHHIKLHMETLNKVNPKKRSIDVEEFIPYS